MNTSTKGLLLGFAILGLSACGANNNAATTTNALGQTCNPTTGVCTTAVGGCQPISSGQISFTLTGASVSNTQILGGVSPYWNNGTSVVGAAYGVGGYGYSGYGGYGSTISKTSSTGSISLSLTSASAVTGMIALNQTGLSMLTANSGYGSYSAYTMPSAISSCVSGVAVNAVYTNAQDAYGYPFINQAIVYLQMNGTTVGPIPFL